MQVNQVASQAIEDATELGEDLREASQLPIGRIEGFRDDQEQDSPGVDCQGRVVKEVPSDHSQENAGNGDKVWGKPEAEGSLGHPVAKGAVKIDIQSLFDFPGFISDIDRRHE